MGVYVIQIADEQERVLRVLRDNGVEILEEIVEETEEEAADIDAVVEEGGEGSGEGPGGSEGIDGLGAV